MRKFQPPGKLKQKELSPELQLPVSLFLQWDTAFPKSSGDPQIISYSSVPGSYNVSDFCSLHTGVHEAFYSPCNNGLSVSPSSVEFLWSNPVGLQNRFLWGSSSCFQCPQARELHVGLRTFTSVGESLLYLFSGLWVTNPVPMSFDFIMIAHLLSSWCGFFFF